MARAHQSQPSKQTLQWNGDNLLEVENLLDSHVTKASASNGALRLIGMGGLDITLSTGDTLIVDGDRLGVIRESRKSEKGQSFVIWKGANIEEFASFLKYYKVRMAVAGDHLLVYGGTKPLILKRGDRLINREGQIIVSVAGKDHNNG